MDMEGRSGMTDRCQPFAIINTYLFRSSYADSKAEEEIQDPETT